MFCYVIDKFENVGNIKYLVIAAGSLLEQEGGFIGRYLFNYVKVIFFRGPISGISIFFVFFDFTI
jgi:hypothetical protein